MAVLAIASGASERIMNHITRSPGDMVERRIGWAMAARALTSHTYIGVKPAGAPRREATSVAGVAIGGGCPSDALVGYVPTRFTLFVRCGVISGMACGALIGHHHLRVVPTCG
jgi:hypothetical protein